MRSSTPTASHRRNEAQEAEPALVPKRGTCPPRTFPLGHPNPPPTGDPIAENVPRLQPKCHDLAGSGANPSNEGSSLECAGYLERGIARSPDPAYNKSGERSAHELRRPPLRGRRAGARLSQF